MHGATLSLGRFLGQILRGEGRPRETIAPRSRTDVEHRIAHTFGSPARDLFVSLLRIRGQLPILALDERSNLLEKAQQRGADSRGVVARRCSLRVTAAARPSV